MKVVRNTIHLPDDPEGTVRVAFHFEAHGAELALIGDPESEADAEERGVRAGRLVRDLMAELQYIPPAN